MMIDFRNKHLCLKRNKKHKAKGRYKHQNGKRAKGKQVKLCKQCGNNFEIEGKSSGTQVFCTKTCADVFYYQPSFNRQKYCSIDCEKKILVKGPQTPNCLYCQKTFIAEGKTSGTQKYCTPHCQWLSGQHRKGIQPLEEAILQCQGCWRTFTPSASSQFFHNSQCRDFSALAQDLTADYQLNPTLGPLVKCQVCSCYFHGRISTEHLASHSLTEEAYTKQYPAFFIFSELSKWKMHENRELWAWADKPESNAIRIEKINQFYEENPGWSSGLTKETDPRVAKQNENHLITIRKPGFIKPFKGQKHSIESRLKMSEKVKAAWRDPIYQAKHTYFISKPQRDLFEAMRLTGLVDKYGFEMEVFVTLKNDKVHPLDIASRKFGFAIEVDGCYYHGCQKHCRDLDKESIVSQVKFDKELFELMPGNYKLMRVWQHEVKDGIFCIVSKLQEFTCEKLA